MKKRMVIVFAVVIVLFVIFFIFYIAFPAKNADVQFVTTEVSSKDVQSNLYIKKKSWGMTSDNQIIVIANSDQKEFSVDSTENYVYDGLMPFFYNLRKDTLFVYTLKMATVPKNLKTSFKVVQIQLDNSEMMKLVGHENYKAQGLKKID